MDFSLIIPALNEKNRLPGFLSSLVYDLNKISSVGEIIIVDDGSSITDYQSYLSLRDMGNNIPIMVLRHHKNLGKGAAIKTGFKVAKGSWIGFVDADGAISATEVIRLLEIALNSQQIDGVFGARIKMLGYCIKRKFVRHFFGRIFTTLIFLLLRIPVYDSQCGCKFFRKSKVLPFVDICKEQQYLFDIELIAMGYFNKLNFLEVPINWHEVPQGKVHFIRDGFKMLIGLWRIKRRLLNKGCKMNQWI